MRNLVLFDFDGTITNTDTLADFSKFHFGKWGYYKKIFGVSLMLLAYKFRIISNHVAKERLISHLFKGMDSADFQTIADRYSEEQIDKIIRLKARDTLQWHQENGHKIVVVSASMENWLRKWCDINNLDLVATKLEIKDNKLTGGFATKNCHGIEKVNRIKEIYNLDEYDVIYAYGNSKGDKEMMNIAHKRFYKYF